MTSTTSSGPLNLTADVVARIFTRQIVNWNDPAILQSNPRLTYAGPILVPLLRSFFGRILAIPLTLYVRVCVCVCVWTQPVVRTDGSGSTFVLSQYLATGSSHWPYGTHPTRTRTRTNRAQIAHTH